MRDARLPRPPRPHRETFTVDGWLRTGDIGELDADGYLSIVDRKKELIISAGGKNMSPANIESRLKAASPLIGSAVVIGDRRPYNVALIVLDPDAAGAPARGSRGARSRRRSGRRTRSLSTSSRSSASGSSRGVGPGRRRADPDDEAQAAPDRSRSTPPRSTRSTPSVCPNLQRTARDVGRAADDRGPVALGGLHRCEVGGRGEVGSWNWGSRLALVCAAVTQLGFLCKHRGAGCAPLVELRRPLASARALLALASGSRSAWRSPPAPGSCTSPRSRSRRSRPCRSCSRPAS